MSENNHTTAHHVTDVAIIGAGPVGLFAIFEAGMLKMKTHVIDALDFVGGQCTALYPEKPIYDIAGFPSVDAADLIENLKKQAAPFDPVYHLGQQVLKCEKIASGFKLTTSKNTIIEAKAIIIAAGCGAFGPNRPPIEGLEQYENKSVFYSVIKKEDFRGKKIVIAGGGDSAVDWALALSDIAARVSVIHRRPKFRCSPESADRLQKLAETKKIDLVIPYQLEALKGSDGKLTTVVVKDLDNNIKDVEADILLPFFGLSMELGPIADWGLNLDFNHIEVSQETLATNIPGIFAIGDIAKYPGKLKLIVCGFSEAAMALYAAYNFVYPDKALHFEYSTTKGVPAN